MFESIKSIFYRPDFFRRQEFTTNQALGFYSLSILFLVLGFSLLLIPALWGVNRYFGSQAWDHQKAIVNNLYPDDLVLTFENGRLMTNQAEPVIIPFPGEWQHQSKCKQPYQDCTTADMPAHLLVIDQGTDVSRKSLTEHDTSILASESEIGFINNDRGEIRIFSLTQANFGKNINITKDQFTYWLDRGSAIVQTAMLFLMVVLPLFMYFGLWIGYIVYSLLGALIVWLAAHLRQHRLTYGQAYRSTLYLLPASFALTVVMSAMSFRIPLLFSLVLFLMALLNFEKKGNRQPEPLPKPVEIIDTPQRPA